YLNSFLTAQSSFWELFLPQAVRGMSLMLCFLPINTLALGTLPRDQLKNAAGLYNLMRNLGGAIGLAGINTMLIERRPLHKSPLADQLSGTNPLVQAWLDRVSGELTNRITGDPDLAALKRLAAVVQREALILSFNDCLMTMACVFVFALL